MKKLWILTIFIPIFYVSIVRQISLDYGRVAVDIGLDGLLYQASRENKKSDSCFYISHYYWNKKQNTLTLLPKFLR